MWDGTVRRDALVASPVFAASVALLVLNDRIFKAAWPGVVTGKLSDVAGVAMVTIMLAALTRRAEFAVVATAVGFTALKVSPRVAEWASPVLGGTTRTDVTDLVALVVLVPLHRWMTRVGRGAGASPPKAGPTVHPSTFGIRLPVQVALVGAAVFATSATSSDCESNGAHGITFDAGLVLVATPDSVYASGDNGATWRDLGAPPWDALFAGLTFRTRQPGGSTDCTDSDPCIEVDATYSSDVVIRRTAGDSSVELLSVTGDQVRRIAVATSEMGCIARLVEDGAVIRSGDGEHVLLAVGTAGVLRRPPNGVWEWHALGEYGFRSGNVDQEPLGFPVATLADDPPVPRGRWVARALPILVIAATAAMAAPITAAARRNGRHATLVRTLVLALAGAMTMFSLMILGLFKSDEGAAALALVGLALLYGIVSSSALLMIALALARPTKAASLRPPDPGNRLG